MTVSIIFLFPTLKERILKQTFSQIFSEDKKITFFSIQHESHAIAAIKIFKDNPILGIGPKNFRFECRKEDYNISEFSCTSHPHNFYIQLLAETGLLGIIIPLIFLFNILKFYIKLFFIKFSNKLHDINVMRICIYSSFLITFFPLIPTGNIFNNWLSIIFYLPLGFFISEKKMINFLFIFLFVNLFIYFFRNKIIKIYNLYDLPDNKRKLHPNKTSIAGGLFFYKPYFIYFYNFLNKELNDFSFLFLSDLNLLYFFLIIVSFFIFGYLDDRFNFNANLKLVILITLVFLILRYDNNLLISYLNLSFSEKIIFLDKFSLIFTIFCFIAFINAFNLFDGINCQIGLYLFFS